MRLANLFLAASPLASAAPVKPVPPPGITLAEADKKPLETGLAQLRLMPSAAALPEHEPDRYRILAEFVTTLE